MATALTVIVWTLLMKICPTILTSIPEPIYLWPLGNSSLYNDVMGSHNILHDNNEVCHVFVDGPPGLPYSIIDMRSEELSSYDVLLKSSGTLRDMTVSFYVYPNTNVLSITGTLLHYQAEDREIMRIRMLVNTLLVSFRDEYGMSAGTMYLVNFLTPKVWNHVVISRHYPTGTIVVYKDGVEKYNMDDEFSDVISFPHDGKLRIGKSQDAENPEPFDGVMACVQLYSDIVPADKHDELKGFCQPTRWTRHFDYYYEHVDDKLCLADPPEVLSDLSSVTMTTLTREATWRAFITGNSLQDSGSEVSYFKIMSRDQTPLPSVNLIGSFNATSVKVCVRLCMRVKGCVAAWSEGTGPGCSLYQSDVLQYEPLMGSKFYKIQPR